MIARKAKQLMKIKECIASGILAAGCVAITGCSTKAKYVDSTGPRTLVTVDAINIQDYAAAADTMIDSLITSVINGGRLKSANGEPAILGISRIINNTSQHVDTDLLTKKIRVALNKTGRVVTTTTYGLGGQGEDPLAQQILKDREKVENKPLTRLPDYSLSGKLIEQRVRSGNTQQASYVFQLTLTSQDGLAVWEEEKTITKQARRSALGF